MSRRTNSSSSIFSLVEEEWSTHQQRSPVILSIWGISIVSEQLIHGDNMLSKKEIAALELSRELTEELAQKIKRSRNSNKIEALDVLAEMASIKAFLTSRTLTVVVAHCLQVEEGKGLKSLYDKWIDLASDDLGYGFDPIKSGYRGMTCEEMDQGTIVKIRELEKQYSNLDDDELKIECEKCKNVIEMFIHGYEKNPSIHIENVAPPGLDDQSDLELQGVILECVEDDLYGGDYKGSYFFRLDEPIQFVETGEVYEILICPSGPTKLDVGDRYEIRGEVFEVYSGEDNIDSPYRDLRVGLQFNQWIEL